MKALLGLLAIAMGLLSESAHAGVVYSWHTTSASNTEAGGYPSFIVSEEAITRGALKFLITGNQCPTEPHHICGTGDYLDFTENSGSGLWEAPGFGRLLFDVIFDADGTLSGTIDQRGNLFDYFVSGSGDNWSGYKQGENLPQCVNGACTLNGYWQRVSEPSAVAILSLSLCALTLVRRRASYPVHPT